jgi:hypothetical protein
VDLGVLRRLKGVLVADLFDFYGKPESEFSVAKWEFGKGLEVFEVELPRDGEVLVFWVEILHEGKKLCSSYECKNWPLVFTYNVGGRFSLSFRWRGITLWLTLGGKNERFNFLCLHGAFCLGELHKVFL